MCIRDRRRNGCPEGKAVSPGPRRLGACPAGVDAEDGDRHQRAEATGCLLYTSDAADERSSVDLGGRRIIKKTKIRKT